MGKGFQPDGGGAGGGDLGAHGAGDIMVVLPVDKQNGNPGLLHGFQRGSAPDIEAAENPAAQRDKGAEEAAGHALVAADLADYFIGGGIGAVRHDAPDALRQGQGGGHEHRGRAHGDARKDQRHAGPAPGGVFRPEQAVLPLVYTQGNDLPLAFPMGPLVNHQCVVPGGAGQQIAAAEIPQGGAVITVHLYQDGRPVPHMVIAAEEPEPVLGTDAQGLVGNGVKSVDQLQDPILVALILLGAWDMSRILPAGNRIVKGHAERGRNQKQDGKREGGKENNKRHLFTRFKPAPSA